MILRVSTNTAYPVRYLSPSQTFSPALPQYPIDAATDRCKELYSMPYVHRYIGPICRIWGRAHHFKLGVDSELYRLQSTILHTCTEASPDQHTLATPAFAPAVVPGPLQRHPWTAEPADSAEPHQSAVRLFRLTLLLFSHSHSHFFLSDSFFLFISLSPTSQILSCYPQNMPAHFGISSGI